MNYQHKYLKYKSKYLEKRYGHIQIFSYKYNDLDYKQKYLKYKSKYLNIKYGGDADFRAMNAKTKAVIGTSSVSGQTGYIDPKFRKIDADNNAEIAKNKAEAEAKAKADAPKIKEAERAQKKITDAKKKIKNKFEKILLERTKFKEGLIKCNVDSEKKWGDSWTKMEDKCPPKEYNNNNILNAIKLELTNSKYDINITKEDILINQILDAALEKTKEHILDKEKLKKHIKSWINSWRL